MTDGGDRLSAALEFLYIAPGRGFHSQLVGVKAPPGSISASKSPGVHSDPAVGLNADTLLVVTHRLHFTAFRRQYLDACSRVAQGF